MAEIKCPNCGKVFSIDESQYESLIAHIKNDEFEKELNRREKEIQNQYDLKLRNQEIQSTAKETEKVASLEAEIVSLREKLNGANSQTLLAVEKEKNSAIAKLEALNNEIARLKSLLDSQKDLSKATMDIELAKKDKEINSLNNKISLMEQQSKIELTEKVNEKDKKINELTNSLELSKKENQLEIQNINAKHEIEKKGLNEELAYYKEMKTRMSTKMIGESLEIYCQDQFNRQRMSSFPRAYFEKDNDAMSGSKGDFIYRDYDENGTEILSIMFEMKNEADTTATKHKNEHFYKELDKDRNEKKCEYAVLVTMLEADSEYFNDGIVDVSYKYDKMFVVRPQFFLAIISILKNASLNACKYKKELELVKNQNIDITKFEDDLQAFKDNFGNNYRKASEKFKTAIEEIDKTITHLQKTKDALLSSDHQLQIANNKVDDISVKKLTRNNPTMKQMFEDLKK